MPAKRINVLLISILFLFAANSQAADSSQKPHYEKDAVIDSIDDHIPEKTFSGISFSTDNDLFVPGISRDQDYSAGSQISFSGSFAKDSWYSTAPLRKFADSLTSFDKLYEHDNHFSYHSMQLGLLIFTPSDINSSDINYDDRPFANMVYVSTSKISLTSQVAPVYTSNFTVGLIGSTFGAEIQTGIHKLIGSDIPDGWDHQISDGGEITGQYAVSRQALLSSNFQSGNTEYELKYNLQAGLGYLTETSASVSGRWGILNTPWWAFTPENSSYASQVNTASNNAFTHKRRELFLFAGVKTIARAYNVFLQGQFRDSDLTYQSDEIRHLLLEAWIGVSAQIGNARLSYVIRSQSKEIKEGAGSRNPVWGGLILSFEL